MENIEGALAYKSTLNIDDFNVSAEAMERRIRNMSSSTISESARMEQSILNFARNGAKYISTYFVGSGMGRLLNSIVQTRGQFQQLEIAFETMLGSGTKAQALMNQMIDTAARTPFDLAGVAGGAKQLLAYGFAAEEVNDTLIRLGNIASGLSVPLGDMVYLYGTTMTQGRLFAQDMRQFMGRGIPLAKELAAMYGKTTEEINAMVSAGKIGFADVEKVIMKMTDSGGQFYNLMEKQSSSLTGMIANLGDAWDMALNKIGQDNQDTFGSAISGATYLVEHLDDILRILKSIAIAYGTYKAAIVANTLATKGFAGFALIENTVRQAKIALMKTEEKMSGREVAIKQKMVIAEKDHVKALREKITLEQHEQVLTTIKIKAINDLLSAEQRRYLANKGLTESSKEYIQEAKGILYADQEVALARIDLTDSGTRYADTIKGMAKKNEQHVKSLQSEAREIKKMIPILEDQKKRALENLEIARMDNLQAQKGTSERRKLTAARKLEVQEERVSILTTEISTATKRKETIETELSTAATIKNAGATVTDSAAKVAATTSTNLLSAATLRLNIAVRSLWVSMKANPIGWIVSLLGIAYSAFTMFGNKTKETEENINGLVKATKQATEKFNEQAAKVDALNKIIQDGGVSYEERNKALLELKKIIPGYHAELDKEGKLINSNTEAIERYLSALEKKIKLIAAQEELEALYRQKRNDEREARERISKGYTEYTTVGTSTSGAVQTVSRKVAYTEEEAQKLLQEAAEKTKEQIEELNNEIRETSQSLEKSEEDTKSYSEQLEEVRKTVSSLKQELTDLRSGKVAKNDLAGVIEEKAKELKDAEGKLALLTGAKVSGVSGSESLNDKILENMIRLEQARIDVMEDGYEKRKAINDLQHKQNLSTIDKEERELKKARKDAGKGGLSADETSDFQSRRDLENKSYLKAQNRLFDDEISYKKEQYQIYWRWVENMGIERANEQFAELIKGGESFKSYLEQQQAELNKKRATGSISEGETNFLISINAQLDEINGVKNAMDQFKESMSKAISEASTLADKIRIVAEFKNKLESGQSGIVGADGKAEASLFVSEQEKSNDKEIQERLLKDFRTFEERKTDIVEEFKLLRLQKQVEGNQILLDMINKGEADALSALDARMLTSSDAWRNLFSDLDSLTVEAINTLINEIEEKMQSADLNLNPADLKALLDQLNQAKQKIVDVNPFQAMGKAIKKIFSDSGKGAKQSSADIKREWSNLAKSTEGAFDFINDAIDGASVLGDALGESGQAAIGALQGVAMAAIAMATAIKTAEKGSVILAAISAVLAIVNAAFALFNKDKKKEKEINSLQKSVDSLTKSYKNLADEIERAYSVGKADLIEEKNKKLEETNKAIRKQIKLEESKKKPDKQKVQDYYDEIEKNEREISENRQYKTIEAIIGIDVKSAIDEFANAYADAWSKGDKAAAKSTDLVRNLIKTAIIEKLKGELKDEVTSFMKFLGDALKDGVLSTSEEKMIAEWEKKLEGIADRELSGKEKWLLDKEDESEDPLTGAIRGMSEQTGSVVAGKLNAVVINQGDQLDTLRQSLIYQQEIAANTRYNRYLESIDARLSRIESSDNNYLLTQGIRG